MTPASVLTADDLPTLRRLVAHYGERGKHRGLAGRIAGHTLARICARSIDVIERHGAMRPEVNYSRGGPIAADEV